MMSAQYNYAGIDIAKRNFVIAVSSLSKTKTKTETNNPKGIAYTIEYLKKHNVALVVMESTGGLEIPAAKAIHRSGIAVIIANLPYSIDLHLILYNCSSYDLLVILCYFDLSIRSFSPVYRALIFSSY